MKPKGKLCRKGSSAQRDPEGALAPKGHQRGPEGVQTPKGPQRGPDPKGVSKGPTKGPRRGPCEDLRLQARSRF